MKKLYRIEDSRYTPEAGDIDFRTSKLVESLFREYLDQGYCPREISKVMQDSISSLELEAILNLPKRS